MRAPVPGLLLLLAVPLAGVEARASTPLPASGAVSCERTALNRCDFRDSESGLHFAWPSDWPSRRLELVTETGPPARARQRDAMRWIAIEYIPDDPGQPQVVLLWVAVLRRADWIAQSGQPGIPREPGVEVATSIRYVAVAGIATANPFPFESRDAEIFDALRPSPEDVSLFVRFADDR